jgi:hypothetical protein
MVDLDLIQVEGFPGFNSAVFENVAEPPPPPWVEAAKIASPYWMGVEMLAVSLAG